MLWLWLAVFILGLMVGSFINVVVYRLAVGLSPWTGRSRCPKCKKLISWYDNIPLLSFVLLRGRCRRCGRPISWQYPVVELLTGLIFVTVCFWQLSLPSSVGAGVFIRLFYWLAIFSALWVVAISDLLYQLIYDEVEIFGVIVWAVGLVILIPREVLPQALIAGLIGAGVFSGVIGLLRWVTRGQAMGLGDVKLALWLGLLVGWPQVILAIQLAFLTGAIAGVILILEGRKGLRDTMAFGPFLVLATGLVLVFQPALWQQYLKLLGF